MFLRRLILLFKLKISVSLLRRLLFGLTDLGYVGTMLIILIEDRFLTFFQVTVQAIVLFV